MVAQHAPLAGLVTTIPRGSRKSHGWRNPKAVCPKCVVSRSINTGQGRGWKEEWKKLCGEEKRERERKMEGLQRRKAGCISVFRVVVGEEVGALWSGRGRGRLVPSPRRRTRPPISEKRHRGPLLQGYFVPAHLRERGTVCFTSMLGIIAGESSWMNTRRLRCVVTLIEKKWDLWRREREREGSLSIDWGGCEEGGDLFSIGF